jgi:hypothetical protein
MELGNRVMNFFEGQFMKILILGAGVYLAGQFIQGVGVGTSKKGTKESSSD